MVQVQVAIHVWAVDTAEDIIILHHITIITTLHTIITITDLTEELTTVVIHTAEAVDADVDVHHSLQQLYL